MTSSLRGQELDAKIVRSSGWIALSYGGRNALTLASMLILVRLLEPRDFGLVALAWAVVFALEQVQASGIHAALIYGRTRVRASFASALVYAPFAAVTLYGVGYLAAPLAARLLAEPALTDILRVLLALLFVRAAFLVPDAILERELDFRSKAKAELAGGFAQATASIGLAVGGLGVWSLVAGQLVGAGVATAILWFVVPWRPHIGDASFAALKTLMSYGKFVSAANIVNLANNTMDNLVIGRILGSAALGYYSIAYRLADFPNTVISYVVGRPMFAVYASVQGDIDAVRRGYVQNLQRVALTAVPVSIVVIVGAEVIVDALLGPRWSPAIAPLQVLGAFGLLKSLVGPAGEVLKGAGKPELAFALSVCHAGVALAALLVLVPRHGILGAAIAMLVAITVTATAAVVLVRRALVVGVREIGRALGPAVSCATTLALALAVLAAASSSLQPLAALTVLLVGGLCIYALSAFAFARGILKPLLLSLRGAGGSVSLR